ncbi:MAG: hypothetical protein HZA34_02760 [Candidatus Pacebacteria bacterium]|nr:hypothetical protein [Candidatus Paceibacterota bacterium]
MNDRAEKNSKKNKKEEIKPRVRKIIVAPEEKAKRGRWITILIFLLTLFFGYAFWQR